MPTRPRRSGVVVRASASSNGTAKQAAQRPAHKGHVLASDVLGGREAWTGVAAAATWLQPQHWGAHPPPRCPSQVVPAFYLDAVVFAPLVETLRAEGYNAALPPIRW